MKENRGCGWETGRGSVYLEHGRHKELLHRKGRWAQTEHHNCSKFSQRVWTSFCWQRGDFFPPQYRAGSWWEQDVLQRYESGNKDMQDCKGEAGKWSLPCSVWEVLRLWATRWPWKWASRCRSVRRKERHQVVTFTAWEGTGRGKAYGDELGGWTYTTGEPGLGWGKNGIWNLLRSFRFISLSRAVVIECEKRSWPMWEGLKG